MILVTGGFGYLGGRICKSLINSGNKVRIGTSRKNVSIPKELSNCDVCEIDLLKPQSLDFACYGITSVIHLAALHLKGSTEPLLGGGSSIEDADRIPFYPYFYVKDLYGFLVFYCFLSKHYLLHSLCAVYD